MQTQSGREMPTFFKFQAGSETRPQAWTDDVTALLGRFRAVPVPSNRPQNRRRLSQLGLLSQSSSGNGSVHVSYGGVLGEWFDDSMNDHEDSAQRRRERGWRGGETETLSMLSRIGRNFWIWIYDVWVDPTQHAVKRVVGVWYSRWGVLVVLPAALVSNAHPWGHHSIYLFKYPKSLI